MPDNGTIQDLQQNLARVWVEKDLILKVMSIALAAQPFMPGKKQKGWVLISDCC